jgi:hypothetical protein
VEAIQETPARKGSITEAGLRHPFVRDREAQILTGQKARDDVCKNMGKRPKTQKARSLERAFLKNYAGDHLISHTVSRAVPSAQRGLTSVFGMGTGVTLAVWSPAN